MQPLLFLFFVFLVMVPPPFYIPVKQSLRNRLSTSTLGHGVFYDPSEHFQSPIDGFQGVLSNVSSQSSNPVHLPVRKLVEISPNSLSMVKKTVSNATLKKLGAMSVKPVQTPRRAKGRPVSSSTVVSKTPLSVGVVTTTGEPRFSRTNRSCRMSHREMVNGSISGSTTWVLQYFTGLNPGLASLFPWVSPQATQWEQYRVHKLHFIYVPIANATTNGDIQMCINYDASDPAPTSEPQMVDQIGCVTGPCWQEHVFKFDYSASNQGIRKFVRPCSIAGDIKSFDVGKFFFSTNNCANSSVVGKLFVEYDFEFFVPQNSPPPYTYPSGTSIFVVAGNTLPASTTSPVALQGAQFDSFNLTALSNLATGNFTPPAACYVIDIAVMVQAAISAGFTNFQMSLLKNGNPVAPTVQMQNAPATNTVDNTMSCRLVVSCNGSDVLQWVVYTGAISTGSASIPPGYGQILFRLA